MCTLHWYSRLCLDFWSGGWQPIWLVHLAVGLLFRLSAARILNNLMAFMAKVARCQSWCAKLTDVVSAFGAWLAEWGLGQDRVRPDIHIPHCG
jgi:hypothetical protein